MNDASDEIINITVERLRQIVQEEVQAALKSAQTDWITRDEFDTAMDKRTTHTDVNAIVDEYIERKYYPAIIDNTAATENLSRTINERMRHFEDTFKRGMENTNAWVQDAREDMKQLTSVVDMVEQAQMKTSLRQVQLEADIRETNTAIFGGNRPGQTSLWDNIDNLRAAMVTRLDTIEANQNADRQATQANTQYRENRQRLERVVTQAIPNLVKTGSKFFLTRAGLALLTGGGALGTIAYKIFVEPFQ